MLTIVSHEDKTEGWLSQNKRSHWWLIIVFSCVESVARVEKFHSEPGENYLDFSVIWPNLAKTLSSRLKLACHSRAILAPRLPCLIPYKRIVWGENLCLAKLSSWDSLVILLLFPQGGFFYFRNPCHILFQPLKFRPQPLCEWGFLTLFLFWIFQDISSHPYSLFC